MLADIVFVSVSAYFNVADTSITFQSRTKENMPER